MSVSVDITIEGNDWKSFPDAEAIVKRALKAVSDEYKPGKVVYSVLLSDDQKVRDLNRVWRNKDKFTNVLAFPTPDKTKAGEGLIGDLAFSYGVIQREAAKQNKTPQHHLAHLVVHGALHLFGLDHQRDADTDFMETREREILARIGVPDPYAAGGRKRKGK